MTLNALLAQLLVYALVGVTCALGLPLFHYVTALMIATVLRHGRGQRGLLAPLGAARIAGS
jgi:hypothetical protein